MRFAGELDPDRVWALEDCRHVSGRLERGLVQVNRRIPAQMDYKCVSFAAQYTRSCYELRGRSEIAAALA